MKLTVMGGGGVRAPLFVGAALRRQAQCSLDELWLMDIDPERLRLIGGLCQQLAIEAGSPVRIHTTTDARAALDGADYIVTTIRVGGEYGRVLDERIALRQGVLGQETTGAGGFAMAMRSIPAILDYARLADTYAPQAWILNFTNPAGLVTQALHTAGFTRSVGICDGANLAQHDAARWFGMPVGQVRAEVFGLNHLSWTRKVWLGEQDVLPQILADRDFCAQSSLRVFDYELLQLFGLYLNEYLYYYYFAERALAQIQNDPKTRGEEVLALNQALLSHLASRELQDNPRAALQGYFAYEKRRSLTYMHYARPEGPDLTDADKLDLTPLVETPEEGEGYAGVALDIIAAMQTDVALETALIIPNQGAIEGMESDDVVEVSAFVTRQEIRPKQIGSIPRQPALLMQTVKLYERLAVDAILQRSVRLAVQALMVHPLVLSYSRATILVDEYLNAHAAFLGEWK